MVCSMCMSNEEMLLIYCMYLSVWMFCAILQINLLTQAIINFVNVDYEYIHKLQ